MPIFIQPTTNDDGSTVYEVFRRTASPRDSTIKVVDSKDQAIAVAGRVAEPGEAIEEFPEQGSFDSIARGPGADAEVPDPPTSDTGGGFIEFTTEGINFFPDPDRDTNESGDSSSTENNALDNLAEFADEFLPGGQQQSGDSEDSSSGGSSPPRDPMADIADFEDQMFGGEDR
jgi:hypothetical protein